MTKDPQRAIIESEAAAYLDVLAEHESVIDARTLDNLVMMNTSEPGAFLREGPSGNNVGINAVRWALQKHELFHKRDNKRDNIWVRTNVDTNLDRLFD